MKKFFMPLLVLIAFVIPALAGTTNLWTTNNGCVNFPITPTSIDGMTIGAETPAPGNFTTLTSTSAPSGAGITALFAAPPPLGTGTPAAVAGTTGTFSGQLRSTAGLPTIASGACGTTTNGAIVAGSTNQSGQITIGAAATTACTISFSATLPFAPKICVITPMNAAAAAQGTTIAYVDAPTTAGFVINGSALASANYGYICL